MPAAAPAGPSAGLIDPRSPRTVAWVTTVVLAVALLVPPSVAVVLLAAQAVAFALGVRGRPPYAVVFRRLVRPRVGPPRELEPAAPLRTAQLVGLVFATVGALGYVAGADVVGTSATAAALAAALLNAAFGLCLGCELHLLLARARGTSPGPRRVPA